MKRLIGFICFWTGIGILIKCIIPTRLSVIVVSVALIIIGYNLFCK